MDRLSILPVVQTVRALFDFKGENNDELCFHQGDIITLTRTPEGGWYEGTLNEITGWFPSNYVEAIDTSTSPIPPDHGHDHKPIVSSAENVVNRKMVIKEIIDSENIYINEVTSVYQSYLVPLNETNILPEKDIEAAINAVLKVIVVHSQLLESLKVIQSKSSSRSLRIGGVFMEFGLRVKEAYQSFCSIYPKFIASVEKRKDAVNLFMKQATTPVVLGTPTRNAARDKEGSVQLTSGLSTIFKRLDKYPALLQELQRYTDEADPDRGDTQRAGFLYREFVSNCLEIRRLKEMEIEVMMGNVKKWPSNVPNVESLGQVVHMGPVTVTHSPINGDMVMTDRYLVLFEKDLLILSVSEEMTSFNYETKFSLANVTLPRLPPHSGLDSFELLITKDSSRWPDDGTSKDGSGRYVFQCTSSEDVKTWINTMYQCKKSIDVINLKSSFEQMRSSFRNQMKNGFRVATPTGSESPSMSSGHCTDANIYDEPSVSFVPKNPENKNFESRIPEIPRNRSPMIPPSPLRQPPSYFGSQPNSRSNSLKKSLAVNNLAGKCNSPSNSIKDDPADVSIVDQFIQTWQNGSATKIPPSKFQESNLKFQESNLKYQEPSKYQESSMSISSHGRSPSVTRSDSDENIDLKRVMEELRLIRHEIKQVRIAVNLVSENLDKEVKARKKFEQFVTRNHF